MNNLEYTYEELIQKNQELELENSLLKTFISNFNDSSELVGQFSYKSLFDFMEDSFLRANRKGEIILANISASKLFEFDSPEEMIGVPMAELYKSSEDRKKMIDDLKKNNILNNYEIELVTKNKKSFYTSSNIKFIRNSKGDIIGTEGLIRDISDKKNHEKQLKQNQEKLNQILDAFDDEIYMNDFDYNIVYINKSMQSRIGEKSLGQKCFKALYGFSKACSWCKLKDQIKNSKSVAYDIKIPNSNKYFYIRSTILNDNLRLSFHHDITDRKNAEITLKENEIELKKLNADKDRFMQILAHDLKSPFNVLLGFSDLLLANLDKFDKEKIRTQISYINETANITYNLLQELLTWTKAQAGQLPFKPTEISFSEIASEVVLLFKNNSKKISVEWFEKENTILFADINMIKTVIRNLVSNAIKFTNNNGEVKICAVKNSDKFAKITISDNGIGIDNKNIEKLWDVTSKFSTTGTNGESGTGLGLLLCKDFVEKHGGKIWVESELDKGSKFIFSVPLFEHKNSYLNTIS